MNNERWRPAVGFEGFYEVSDHGRVRSVDRYIPRPPSRRHPGGWLRFYPGQLIVGGATSTGHWQVVLSGPRGKEQRLIHRLVLEAFVGPCPERQEGTHRDDVPSNNHLSNLRWATRSQNVLDAYRNGRRDSRKGVPRSWRKAA